MPTSRSHKGPERPPFPLHPFLLAIAPLWAMYAANVDRLQLESFLRPAVWLLMLTAVGLLALRPLVSDLVRRGFLVYVLIWPMHGYVTLYGSLGFVPALWRHILAAGVLAIALGLAALALQRMRFGLNTLTVFLNATLSILLVLEGIRAVNRSWAYLLKGWQDPADEIAHSLQVGPMRPLQPLPDIYYIILDGYARQDVLKEVYSFDNSEFLSWLSDRGFYIPSDSRANYPTTYLSLASSLNGALLDPVQSAWGDAPLDSRILARLIEDNGAARRLRDAGYTYVFVGSDFEATWSSSTADACICHNHGISQLETRWANRTPLALWPEAFRWVYDPFEVHRRKVSSQLDTLGGPTPADRPWFVFAHILAPHPPFVFGSEGQPVQQTLEYSINDCEHPSRELYIEGYREQLRYVNERLKEIIDEILARSATPPVIILQADHGPNSSRVETPPLFVQERYAIFAAYYLPGEGAGKMYDTITPVNTFRVVFDAYFGTQLGLLPDASYSSLVAQVYP